MKKQTIMLCVGIGLCITMVSCERASFNEEKSAIESASNSTENEQRYSSNIEKTADLTYKTSNAKNTQRKLTHVANALGGVITESVLRPVHDNMNTIRIGNDSLQKIVVSHCTVHMTVKIPSESYENFVDSVIAGMTEPEILQFKLNDVTTKLMAKTYPNLDTESRNIQVYNNNQRIAYSTLSLSFMMHHMLVTLPSPT